MKTSLLFGVALAAFTLVVPVLPSALAAGEKVGVSAAVRGAIQVSSAGSSRSAKSGESMLMGDRIASKAESGMQVMLLDQTTFTIGANCDITIDEFVYDPKAGAGSVTATVSKGALRYVSGLISKDNPDAVKLKTPSSTIGLRGTGGYVLTGADAIKVAAAMGFDVTGADPATASLIVLAGPGAGRNTLDNRGEIVVTNAGGSKSIYKAGYGVFVPSKTAQPAGPVRMSDDAMRALLGLLSMGSVAKAGGSGTLPGGSAVIGSGQDWVEGKPFDQQPSQFQNQINELKNSILEVPKGDFECGNGCNYY